MYHRTPHCATSVPPAELLFNRTVKGILPALEKIKIRNRHEEAKGNEVRQQQYNKEYSDRSRNSKSRDVKIGDNALIRQQKQNNLSANFFGKA